RELAAALEDQVPQRLASRMLHPVDRGLAQSAAVINGLFQVEPEIAGQLRRRDLQVGEPRLLPRRTIDVYADVGSDKWSELWFVAMRELDPFEAPAPPLHR